MHVVSRYTAAWPRHRPERGFCRRSLAVKHGSRYRRDRHAESADGTERRLRRRVGIHTRAFLALSLAPGGDALGLSAVGGRLAAGTGGLVWRAGLARHAAGRGVWRGGGGCRLADCGGTVDAVWAQTRWRNAAERGRCHRGDAIGPTHCRGRAQRRVLRLRRAAGPVAARRADRAHQAAGECGVSESGRQMKRDGVSHPAW